MSPLDPNNPSCPQCGDSCSSAYRCRYCDCNIHVFCCLDYGRTAELGHGAHYRCSRPECILSRELVHSTVRTSPRGKSSSTRTEVAPEQLHFTPKKSGSRNITATASMGTNIQPSVVKISNRNGMILPTSNPDAKCSLHKQSKCRHRSEQLFRCVVTDCVQHIHEKCCYKIFSEKNRELFLDKEQCVVLVCSVSCHNKLVKTEKVAVDKAGKKWSNDNPNPTKTSEALLLAWLTTEGNYAAYRGACGGGESKLAQLQELSESIIKAGSCARKPKDILKKIQKWENDYRNAIDWKCNTGAGLDSPGDINEHLVKLCKHFFALEPIMKDRGGSRPLLTNRERDNSSHSNDDGAISVSSNSASTTE
jgi:hypothetical protein